MKITKIDTGLLSKEFLRTSKEIDAATEVWEKDLNYLTSSTKSGLEFVRRKFGFLQADTFRNTVEVCAVFGEEAVKVQFDKEDLITLLTELP